MKTLTFQVIEGVDKGRVFRDLPTPVTIGREEGNLLRLNDERVSRFHAKVQYDDGEIILTDLESTNGTRVNGTLVQIRRLRPGDRISVGRSMLLFGYEEEIAARKTAERARRPTAASADGATIPVTSSGRRHRDSTCTPMSPTSATTDGHDCARAEARPAAPAAEVDRRPGRSAGRNLRLPAPRADRAAENIHANDDGTQVRLSYADWQTIQAVQMLLARYIRAVAEPERTRRIGSSNRSHGSHGWTIEPPSLCRR